MAGDNAFLLASLAQVHAAFVFGGFRLDDETRQTGERYARHALALDPAMAPAHCALGALAFMRGDPKLAFVHLKRGVLAGTDDPNDVFIFAYAAAAVGRGGESRPFAEGLLQSDPLSAMAHAAAAVQRLFEGRFEAALEPVQVALRLDPGSVQVRYLGVTIFAANRRLAEAHDLIVLWRAEEPEHPFLLAVESFLSATEGRHAESAALLEKLLANQEVRKGMRADPIGVWVGAEICALNGALDQGLEWLAHGLEMGCINYPFLAQIDPWLENVRTDSRFEALMTRVKREWEAFEV